MSIINFIHSSISKLCIVYLSCYIFCGKVCKQSHNGNNAGGIIKAKCVQLN